MANKLIKHSQSQLQILSPCESVGLPDRLNLHENILCWPLCERREQQCQPAPPPHTGQLPNSTLGLVPELVVSFSALPLKGNELTAKFGCKAEHVHDL